MNRRSFHGALNAFGAALSGGRASAFSADGLDLGLPNVPIPTLGGLQFWADELCFREWKIQRNILTGHHRLLDGEDIRHAWGTYAQCLNKLEEIKETRKLKPMRGAGVVLLHGLTQASADMRPLGRYLGVQGKAHVFNVGYPSTRAGFADHAAQLHRLLTRLEGIDRLHLVGHSMGNLVIRHYWQDQIDGGLKPDPRIRRIVMLAPPNQGSKLAEMLAANPIVAPILGSPGQDFARNWDQLAPRLGTPTVEFGIIAGGRGTKWGYNPLLGEDNDFIVTVESTKLAGAADWLCLPALHPIIMNDAAVKRAVANFFRHGWFRSEAERQPLE